MEAETIGSETQFCSNCGNEISIQSDTCPDCGVDQESNKAIGGAPLSRLKATLVGAVVSFFVGWIPFVGPIGAGILAGYLRGQNSRESALTGFLANLIGAIPPILFGILGIFVQILDGTMSSFVIWILLGIVFLVYYCGLGAFGGWIGAKITDKAAPEN